jgi:hypothetical protein
VAKPAARQAALADAGFGPHRAVQSGERVLRRLFILRLPRIDRDSKAPQRRVSRQSDLPADLMAFSLRSNYIKRSHPVRSTEWQRE